MDSSVKSPGKPRSERRRVKIAVDAMDTTALSSDPKPQHAGTTPSLGSSQASTRPPSTSPRTPGLNSSRKKSLKITALTATATSSMRRKDGSNASASPRKSRSSKASVGGGPDGPRATSPQATTTDKSGEFVAVDAGLHDLGAANILGDVEFFDASWVLGYDLRNDAVVSFGEIKDDFMQGVERCSPSPTFDGETVKPTRHEEVREEDSPPPPLDLYAALADLIEGRRPDHPRTEKRKDVPHKPFPPSEACARVLEGPRMLHVNRFTGLKLGGNPIGDDGVLTLCRSIRFGALAHLQCLDLHFCQLTELSCRYFARYLMLEPPADLEPLPDMPWGMDGTEDDERRAVPSGLRSTKKGASDATAAAGKFDDAQGMALEFGAPPPLNDAVNGATHVVSLRLAWNDLGDDGARVLGSILGRSSFLVELDLSHNGMTPDGAEMLRDGMRRCSSIVRCHMAGNKVMPPVQDAINAMLVYNEKQLAISTEESVVF